MYLMKKGLTLRSGLSLLYVALQSFLADISRTMFSAELYMLDNWQTLLIATLCGFMWIITPGVQAQIPAVCAANVTRSGVCCPSWEEDGKLICGGSDRGRCVRLKNNDDISKLPNDYHQDDRIHWPTRLLHLACECYGNFAGYMCHECREGFKGDNCTEKFTKIRRNLNSLNLTEKQNIVQIMDTARYVVSDFVVQNMTHSSDPSRDPQFQNVSVYDYLAYLHYYASRMTNLGSEGKCENATYRMDCAHRGSNFPIWHRYYMILWEREMGKIAGDPAFTFPYWDWRDGGSQCELCTDEFLGATNTSDPDKSISEENILATWYALCYSMSECETCDPGIRFKLVRHPGNNAAHAGELPTSAEVSSFMALDTYDYPDFVVNSRASSFRARFEGYSTIHGPTSKLKMHNLVHAFMNGSFSGALTSSFDPVFYFHHSFMDKLLETWLRRTGAQVSQLPSVGSHPGHHRDSYLVAFFPVAKASWYFISCRHLGYDYDDMSDSYMSPALAKDVSTEGLGSDMSATAETNKAIDNISEPSTGTAVSSTTTAIPRTSTSSSLTNQESVNPLVRYVIIEGAIIGVLLIALISECTFRFRYFIAHHHQGYQQLNRNDEQKLPLDENLKTLMEPDDESDCE